jgi:hypothetical protein
MSIPPQLPKPSGDMPLLLDDRPIDHRDGVQALFGQGGLHWSLWDYVVDAIHQQQRNGSRTPARSIGGEPLHYLEVADC